LDEEISRILLNYEKYCWEYSKAHELCEIITNRIERRVHRQVTLHEWKADIGWSFYSTRNFASAGWRKVKQSLVIDTNKKWADRAGGKVKQSLVIDTNKKWADRAGVSELADATTENGWHGEPSCIWYVQAGDVEKRERVAGYLAQVCIARHRRM